MFCICLLYTSRVVRTLDFLAYTDLNLEELAEILGFVDSAHISRVFMARTGSVSYTHLNCRNPHPLFCNYQPIIYTICLFFYLPHRHMCTAHFFIETPLLINIICYGIKIVPYYVPVSYTHLNCRFILSDLPNMYDYRIIFTLH